MNKRMQFRLLGLLKARLPELGLDRVQDPRLARGKRWDLEQLLRVCITGQAAGCQSLAEVEELSLAVGSGVRRILGVHRRVPDTTLRDTLVRLAPHQVRTCLHRQVRTAQRRKALRPKGLPFGVVAMDGKSVTLEAWDGRYAQRHRTADYLKAKGLLRTFTCCLTSSRSKMCIDTVPISPKTNEMGGFIQAFDSLCQTYPRLFRLVTADAGMCSLENADHIRTCKKDYLLALKADQPTLYVEGKRLLARKRKPAAETTDVQGHKQVRRALYMSEEMAGYMNWRHLKTVIRVESEERDLVTGEGSTESRYFISSLNKSQRFPYRFISPNP